MAAKFVHAVDTRYKPARKVRVPEQHLNIFPYLKARDTKSETQKADTAATETKTTPKGGK